MATNDMGPGPLKKARHLVKKITKKVTKGTFLEDSKKYPGEKNNPFAQKGGTTKKYQKGGLMVTPTTGSGSVANFIKERSPLKPKPKKIGLKDNRLKRGIKMQKGGKTTSFTDDIATGLDNVFRKTYPFNIPHTQVTKALKAVDDKITKGHEGEQPDWYNKFKDKVKKTMHVPTNKKQDGGVSSTEAAKRKTAYDQSIIMKDQNSIRDQKIKDNTKRNSNLYKQTMNNRAKTDELNKIPNPLDKNQKGGAAKKMQAGGVARGKNITQKAAERKSSKGKGYISSVMGENPSGDKGVYVPFTRAGKKDAKTKGMVSSKEMKPSRQIMKTGGMVNANANLKATATAGSRGVKAGVNPKAAASKVARGKVGGTSTAPKMALPKAQKGWSVEDPYKKGVRGQGATATKTSPRTTGGLSVIHGGTKTKTISAGGIYPGAKGSITKTKTNNKGQVTGSKTREISQERANKIINRKRG